MTRERAIEVLKAWDLNWSDEFTTNEFEQAFAMAISALSENKGENRPKGEWIEVVEEKFPNGEKRMWHYKCSACSTVEPPCPINKEHWDFCPNCGADMRGKDE